MKAFFNRLSDLMPADASLTVLLGFLIADLFVLQPIEALSGWAKLLIDIVTVTGIVLSILAVLGLQRATGIFVVLAGAALLLRGLRLVVPGDGIGYVQSVLSLVAIAILAWLVLKLVLRSGRVTIRRIQGAVVVYLLLGMMWTQAYRMIALYDPSAFVLTDEVSHIDPEINSKLGMFSFSVLTASSFIDMTPVNPVARSLAMLEALIGQLYLVILIARLVSLEVESNRMGDR
ncbi:putative Ion transport 2 domain protein [Nitrospira japonica]|uniref:Putative Ion transport 2 domain protein n=1 Tax=Nitrospira japonica TaxID=1325564 RepID=A0A1W1I9X7_9BACT|nr:hypothetical protein [Nitrospira japonica]SLM49857.1 putative Ion transport 2 domain protein [Nitrospira japonica]